MFFVFTSSYRFVVWRFAFFGSGAFFMPVINVSAVFASSFRCTVWLHFVAKVFRVGHSDWFLMQAVFTNSNWFRHFLQGANVLFKQLLN